MAEEPETPDASEDTPSSEAERAAQDESTAETSDATAPEGDASSAAAPEAEEPSATDAEEEQHQPAATPEAPEALHPKERRRRARAEKAAGRPARPPTTPEERQQERAVERRRKREGRRAARLRAREKERERAGDGRETPPRGHAPGKQQTRQGVVVSNRAAKTITVRIDTTRRHRRYEKIVRTSRTLHAHDERGEAGIGDTVLVRESRPLSRSKRWRLVEIVEKAE
jgi:small subunit ribosomal protein S17